MVSTSAPEWGQEILPYRI